MWGIIKWLVIPFVMGVLGYVFIGPKIGDSAVLQTGALKVKDAVDKVKPTSDEPIAESGPKSKHGEVKLDVQITDPKDEKKPNYFSPDSEGR